MHEQIIQEQKKEIIQAIKKRRQNALLAKVKDFYQQITPEKEALIFSGKAFTAHQAVQLGNFYLRGLVDKISTFEEFKREKFKDMSVVEDRLSTARQHRFFRYSDSSNDLGALDKMFVGLLDLDIADLEKTDLKDLIANSFEKMSPEQIREAVGELAGLAAEYNLQRTVNAN